MNDFELELYNSSSNQITPDDIYDYYHGWWAPPEINNMSNGVELIWRGEPIEAGQWMHFGLNISKYIDDSVLSNVRYNWTTHCGVGSYEIYYRIWNGTEWSPWYNVGKNESVMFNLSSKGYDNSGEYYIEYYAVDDLGNNYTTPLNETVCVDNSPPESYVDVEEPSYYKSSEAIWYVTTHTPIWINTTDSNACDSGCQYLHWEAYIDFAGMWIPCNVSVWNGTGFENRSSGNETSNKLLFHFNEECHHLIVYYGVDNVSNIETMHEIEFKVDDSPPDFSVNVPNGSYVRSDTDITISPYDTGACPVGSYHLIYNVWNESSGWKYDITDQGTWPSSTYPVTINLEGECIHYINLTIWDELGNTAYYNLTYIVDNSPPVSHVDHDNNSYVSLSEKLRLWADDMPEKCPVGGITIKYRIYSVKTGVWSAWKAVTSGVFINFSENCTHYLEFYSFDALHNTEDIHNYTFYVDTTPPTTTIAVEEPKQGHYVTSSTPIWLNASDAGCNGGAGVGELHYIIRANNLTQIGAEGIIHDGDAADLNDTDGNISVMITLPDMEQYCNFTIEYWSVDNVSNEETHHYEYFLVDNTPPEINMTIGEPQYDKDGMLFINFSTPIWVNATDGNGECAVGSVNLSVKVYWLMDGYNLVHDEFIYVPSGWANIEPFNIDEECIHWINITAVDDLGNVAYYNKTVYVDNSPPVLEKEIGEPKYEIGSENMLVDVNVSQATSSAVGSSSLEQSFTPHVDRIDAVKLYLVLDWSNPQPPTPITVNIRDSSNALLGTNTTTIAGTAGWFEFNFSTIHLTPGQEYRIEVQSSVIQWGIIYSDIYSEGQVISPSWASGFDFIFKTEYRMPPEVYITSQTPIYLNFTDDGTEPCIVGSLHVNVSVYSFLTGNTTYYEWNNLSGNAKLNETIYLGDECMNWVNITMWDDLGNVAWDNETFYVDDSEPVSHVNATVPHHQDAPIEISINVSDYPSCYPSGLKNVTLYYRYAPYNHSFGDWTAYITLKAPPWNWSFDAPDGPGYYQFCSIAYDNLNHKENKTLQPESWVCVPYSDFTFHFVEGFNLITMPVKSKLNASMLAKAIGEECEIVVRYDSVNQIYVDYIVGISAPNNKDFDIIPGMGYFVGLSAGKDITIADMRAAVGDENLTGCLIENISIELHPGLNLIGWSNIVDTTASCVAQYFNNSHDFGNSYHQITLTNWLEDIQQFGDGYPIDLPPWYGFDIYFGDAFFIFVPGDETVMWYGGDRMGEECVIPR